MSASPQLENDKGTRLLKKADMLDQVNELLDLMLSEKNTLQMKIAELECELKQAQRDKSPLLTSQATATEGGLIKLMEKIEKERESIKLLAERVNQLETYVDSERETYRARATEAHSKHMETINKQRRGNKKLERLLAQSKDANRQLEMSNNAMKCAVEAMRNRYVKTRTAYLAVKGRNAIKEKEENAAIASERECLIQELEKERASNIILKQQLEDKVKNESILQQKLTNVMKKSENLTCKYSAVKEHVEGQLIKVDTELHQARNELSELRTHLVHKQTELHNLQQVLLKERKWAYKLLAQGRAQIHHLTTELTKHKLADTNQVDKLKSLLLSEQIRATQEINRIKDVSAKRCTELAQELWLLKAKLKLQK